MKKYDYSGLIKAIGEIKADQIKAINKELFSQKQKLADLENKVLQSGMLEDWNGLKKVCRKVRVPLITLGSKVGDVYQSNGMFGKHIDHMLIEGGYSTDYFIFGFNYDEGNLNWGFSSKKSFYKFKGGEMIEINYKITLLNTFLETYEAYREIQLQKVFAAMGKIAENTEKIRGNIEIQG